jgi:hypothetical protein
MDWPLMPLKKNDFWVSQSRFLQFEERAGKLLVRSPDVKLISTILREEINRASPRGRAPDELPGS